jgi:hypothetical protein
MKIKPVTRRSVLAAMPVGGALMAGLVARPAETEPQPAMVAALESLRAAKTNLQLASHDKGGHRGKALLFTQRAINEVALGIKFDNQH